VFLMCHPSVPVQDVKEFVAYVKAHPGKLSYGSAGSGSSPHLAGEMMKAQAGVFAVHVPYRGAAPAVIDLVAGRVDMMFVGVLPSQGHLATGALRALAVTAKTRMPEVPEAPTMAEVGYPDVDSEFVWFGLMAPARTPEAAIKTLHEIFAKAVASPDVRSRLAAQGITVGACMPAELAARIKADTAKFAPIVKASSTAR
jgi:tripartite-type tricarboxylate transporter receptor subunit TctC